MIDLPATSPDAVMEAFFLGSVPFDAAMALQQRLVYEISGRDDGQVALLLCEHPELITIGRQGSRAHVRLSGEQLANREIELRWVNRGGGCQWHAGGQLAVYPIVPLAWHGLSVGAYLDRLQSGIVATLAEIGVAGQCRAGAHGVWGRGGQLATIGVAVRSWTTYFGAYINVDPALRPFRHLDADPLERTPATSLAAERRQPVRMTTVRATIVRHLADALGCQRYHLYTGHPLASHLAAARRAANHS